MVVFLILGFLVIAALDKVQGIVEPIHIYIVAFIVLFHFYLMMKKKDLTFPISKSITNHLFFLVVFFLILPISVKTSISIIDSAEIYLVMLFSFFLGVYFYFLVYNFVSLKQLSVIISILTFLMCLAVIIEFFLALIGLSKPFHYGSEGLFNLGRPGGFFREPGMMAFWIVVNCGLLHVFYRKNIINKQTLLFWNYLAILTCFIQLTRIPLFLLLLNLVVFDRKNFKAHYFPLLTIGLLLILYLKDPQSRMLYDILDIKRNPRLNDFLLILDNLKLYDRTIFGMGIGTIGNLNEYYPWRNFGRIHNSFIISVFYEYGIVGLLIFHAIFFQYLAKFRGFVMRLLFYEMYIVMLFHNMSLRPSFALTIAILIFVQNKLNNLGQVVPATGHISRKC